MQQSCVNAAPAAGCADGGIPPAACRTQGRRQGGGVMNRGSRRGRAVRRTGLRIQLHTFALRNSALHAAGVRPRVLQYGLRTAPLHAHLIAGAAHGAGARMSASAKAVGSVRSGQTSRAEAPVLELDAAICRKLALPDYPVRAVLRSDSIRLGPAIAAYAILGTKRLFGTQTKLFADMAILCREANVDFFVLTPGHLRSRGQKARAYRFYPKRAQWELEDCPWPDFVWRRTVVRPARMHEAMNRDEELLLAASVLGTLPRQKSEKWLLHNVLSAAPGVQFFLPPVYPIHSAEDVLHAVRALGDIYVKPARGTQGQKIMRLVSLQPGYLLLNDAKRNPGGEIIRDDEALLRRFRQADAERVWIAQRTVELMRTRTGAPIDLRFLVQARSGGQADCTGSVARIGSPGAVTTNLHTGAQAHSFADVEQYLQREQIPQFRHGVRTGRTAALAAFSAVAADHPALAELGVDVALDRFGRAYILEVNPCPGRQMFRLVDPEARRLSLQRVLEYAVFSTGFDLIVKGEGEA